MSFLIKKSLKKYETQNPSQKLISHKSKKFPLKGPLLSYFC
jgi:hypothetical protein